MCVLINRIKAEFILLVSNIEYHYLSFIRERPFNLKGGIMVFFQKKYSDSQCCWKKYSDFGGGKKIIWLEFLSYNLMLNSGEKKNF